MKAALGIKLLLRSKEDFIGACQVARCLVTGADGFIGSHLCEMLRDEGHEVTGMAQYNSFDSYGWLDEVEGVGKVYSDVRQPGLIFEDTDYVFHLAALIDVAWSYEYPRAYIDTNVSGTFNILAACRRSGAKLIHTSSSEVYGTAQYTPQDEKHPINPQSPYAASKCAADALVRSYHYSYGLPSVILRPFNTYGPRQSQRAVIPRIIKQALGEEREITLGNLEPKRDFMYVTDTCRAFLAVMDLPFGEYNAGTGESVKIGALPSYVTSKRVVSDETKFRPDDSEVMELRCDHNKIYGATQWMAKVSLLDGMRKTRDWFASSI
jgi:nucleoside-diphosphate-sugar epimerase